MGDERKDKRMKKIFALLLAALLLVGMSIPTLALNSTVTESGNSTLDVNGTLIGTGSYEPPEVKLSVDVSWESMSFTYTGEAKGTWVPDDHSYINSVAGSWSDNKPAITVTNHSNANVEAKLAFAAAHGVTATGTFYTKTNETYTALNANEQCISLSTAEGTSYSAAPAGAVYFGVSGDGVAEGKSIGTVTVTISKDSRVFDIAQFVDKCEAAKNGGTVTLGANLDFTSYDGHMFYGFGSSDNPFVLDLDGHSFFGCIWVIGSNLVIKNGTLGCDFFTNSLDNFCILNVESALKLQDVTVNTSNGMALFCNGGSVDVKDCTLNGYSLDTDYEKITVWICGGSIELSGKTTISERTFIMDSDEKTSSVTVYAGGTYSLGGNSYTFTENTVYTTQTSELPPAWLKALQAID